MLKRDVEIDADQDTFFLNLNITDGFLLHTILPERHAVRTFVDPRFVGSPRALLTDIARQIGDTHRIPPFIVIPG